MAARVLAIPGIRGKSLPCQGIRLRMDGIRKARTMTRAQLALVLAALPDEWQPFFTFLAQTGLRVSEAVGLQWQHVDLGVRPHIKVRRPRGQPGALKTRNMLPPRTKIATTPPTRWASGSECRDLHPGPGRGSPCAARSRLCPASRPRSFTLTPLVICFVAMVGLLWLVALGNL